MRKRNRPGAPSNETSCAAAGARRGIAVVFTFKSFQRQTFVFARSMISSVRPLMTAFTAPPCTQQIREENLAAYAVEILPNLNLAISYLAIYSTQVEPDTLVVSLR
jgi:hypothetical protein